jgi:hypothetical protein
MNPNALRLKQIYMEKNPNALRLKEIYMEKGNCYFMGNIPSCEVLF